MARYLDANGKLVKENNKSYSYDLAETSLKTAKTPILMPMLSGKIS